MTDCLQGSAKQNLRAGLARDRARKLRAATIIRVVLSGMVQPRPAIGAARQIDSLT